MSLFRYLIRSKRIVLFLFTSIFFFNHSIAQEKTNDTLALTMSAKHRANRAAIMSAVIPGAGQIYNKSYWKVPVLYGGFAALVYFIDFNNKNYKTFKSAYLFRTDADSTTIDNFPGYTDDDLLVRKDYYRRNRDFCYILTGVVYVLNIIDAYVDAHLKDFDVSDDLSLHTHPYINIDGNGTPVAGISLCLKLNK